MVDRDFGRREIGLRLCWTQGCSLGAPMRESEKAPAQECDLPAPKRNEYTKQIKSGAYVGAHFSLAAYLAKDDIIKFLAKVCAKKFCCFHLSQGGSTQGVPQCLETPQNTQKRCTLARWGCQSAYWDGVILLIQVSLPQSPLRVVSKGVDLPPSTNQYNCQRFPRRCLLG